MVLNSFVVAAVFVVVNADTLVENFYLKLKDLGNQYTSEIEELKQLNNEQRSMIDNLTRVIEETSLRSVVNEQRRVLERILFTLIYHKIENFQLLWPKLTDVQMWLVVMCASLNYCPNLSATDIGAKNPI